MEELNGTHATKDNKCKEGVVSEGYLVDAQHIAIATVNRIDVLVSWNFRHIMNLTRIRLYNSVNLKYGYPLAGSARRPGTTS